MAYQEPILTDPMRRGLVTSAWVVFGGLKETDEAPGCIGW